MRTERIIFTHFHELLNRTCEDAGIFKDSKTDVDGVRPANMLFAAKHGHHCRRSVKPDPLAAWFLYRWAYENRNSFRRPHYKHRSHFGYRLVEGAPISIEAASTKFRRAEFYAEQHRKLLTLRFDIGHYFNTLYHHDIVKQLRLSGFTPEPVRQLARVLRWLTAGRTIDCLPQGIYPAKMIGSYVLTPVDNDAGIGSWRLFRMMDDFLLVDADWQRLIGDFHHLQYLLGQLSLGVNQDKTRMPTAPPATDLALSDEERSTEEIVKSVQDKTEAKARVRLRFTRRIPPKSARDLARTIAVALDHPDLVKQLSFWFRTVRNKDELGDVLWSALKSRFLTDYQLFWLAHIADEHLLETASLGKVVDFVFKHPNASDITKARILEIPTNKFGMAARREIYLRQTTGWTSWAAGIGMLNAPKDSRNQLAKYVKNDGIMGRMMSQVIHNLDPQAHAIDWSTCL